jgi:hypothetical protein
VLPYSTCLGPPFRVNLISISVSPFKHRFCIGSSSSGSTIPDKRERRAGGVSHYGRLSEREFFGGFVKIFCPSLSPSLPSLNALMKEK